MFDFDTGLDGLELGSRRRPVKWAVELSLADCRPQKHKERKRQEAAQADTKHRERQAAHHQREVALRRQPEQREHATAGVEGRHPLEVVTPAQAKYRREFRDANAVCLSTEIEQGNVEYKYMLTACITNENRRHQLVTQMKFRLSEGSGECFYYLGVEDDGYPRGLEDDELQDTMAVLHHMAQSLQATARLVEYVPGGFGRTAALMHIKANAEEDMQLTDSRIAVAGSMDSAKSTLVAVLTHGADGRPLLDNGRGSARMAVFRHKHEIESGRTSSICQQALGYDDEGRVLNYVGVATPTPADITAAATHMVTFIDMGGHEKYLKTTLYGMTCLLPDYALLCVDACTGITRITREHLAVAVALEVPTALVVTKADAVDTQQLQQLLDQLHQLMQPVLYSCQPQQQQQHQHQQQGRQQQQPPPRKQGQVVAQRQLDTASSRGSSGAGGEGRASSCNDGGSSSCAAGSSGSSSQVTGSPGVPVVQTEQQAIALAASLSELHSCTAAPAAPSFQQAVFPTFVVSCVTGAGIPLLHAFLSHLRPLQEHEQSSRRGSQQAQAGVPPAAATAASVVGSSSSMPATGPLSEQQQQGPVDSHKPVANGSSQLWGGSPHKPRPAATAAAAADQPCPATSLHAVTPAAGSAEAPAAAAAAAAEDAAGGVGDEQSGHFQVVHTYDVEGVGWVVSGIAVTGTVEVGQSLLWGPTPQGGFSPVRVTCIQRSHVPVRQIAPGQTATLALQPTTARLPHSSSKQALLTAAAVAQAAAAEAAAREAAAAIAAVPQPVAKTRRRSPAALKAAAAAAASTAAAAAAAVDAARRAAALAGGETWWPQAAGADSGAAAEAGRDAAVAVGAEGAPAATPAIASASGPPGMQLAPNAAAASGVDDLLLDDLAAVLDDASEEEGQDSPSRDSSSSSRGNLCNSWSFSSDSSTSMRGAFSRAVAAPGSLVALSRPASASAALGASAAGAAAAAAAEGDRSLAACMRSASEQQLLRCSSGRWRSKGGVLLDAAVAPHTYWEFEALLVLLGGHWPARGLLSGCWPPAEHAATAAEVCAAPAAAAAADDDDDDVGLAAHQQQQQVSASAAQESTQEGSVQQREQQHHSRKQRRRSKQYEFAYVVHCNSIRQIARVISMQELRGPGLGLEPLDSWSSSSTSSSSHDVFSSDSPSGRTSSNSSSGGVSSDGMGTEEMASCPHTSETQQQQQQPQNGDLQQQGQQPQEEQQAHGPQRPLSALGQQCGGLTVSIRAAAALLQGASAATSDREASSGCASGDSSSGSSRRQRQRRGSSSAAAPAAAAAAAAGAASSSSSKRASDAGSVVTVRFRFTHRPEWMQVGARLIVRDRSDGHVAAAGFVTKLLEPHAHLQQRQEAM